MKYSRKAYVQSFFHHLPYNEGQSNNADVDYIHLHRQLAGLMKDGEREEVMRKLSAQRLLPPLVGSALCIIITACLCVWIKRKTGGLFVFPLDDSYIHLALARTFAVNHVWGIGPDGFASASSSPGWTLLLSLSVFVLGTHLATPIILNLLFAVGVLFTVDALFLRVSGNLSVLTRCGVQALVVVATPLPCLALIGMEHMAQTLSILLLAFFSVQILSTDPRKAIPRSLTAYLIGTGFFAGGIRYEAVFAVGVVCVLLLFRGRWKTSSGLGLAAAAMPVMFGVYFYHLSNHFLPFSILVKASQRPGLLYRAHNALLIVLEKQNTLPFLGVLLLLWISRFPTKGFWNSSQLLLCVSVCSSLGHLLFAPVGWLVRYESYLVCLNLTAFSALIFKPDLLQSLRSARESPWWASGVAAGGGILCVVSIYQIAIRTVEVETEAARAAVDRYDEHIQMARFIASAYDHDPIVIDDIGAVAFYTHAHILDMVGLGSIEPLLPKRQHRSFTAADMRAWAERAGAPIAILQTEPTNIRLWTPSSWILVQQWKQPRNVVFGDLTTSLFATNRNNVQRLCQELLRFSLVQDDRIMLNACPALIHADPNFSKKIDIM